MIPLRTLADRKDLSIEKTTKEIYKAIKEKRTDEIQLLALKLIFVPIITENCLLAFKQVANYCDKIDLGGHAIGFESLLEFHEYTKLFKGAFKNIIPDSSSQAYAYLKNENEIEYNQEDIITNYNQILGSYGKSRFEKIIEEKIPKPFSTMGLIRLYLDYNYVFTWIKQPDKIESKDIVTDFSKDILKKLNEMANQKKQKKELTDECPEELKKLRIDAFIKFLKKQTLKTDESWHFGLITSANLLNLIEILNQKESGLQFYPPKGFDMTHEKFKNALKNYIYNDGSYFEKKCCK